MNTLLDKFGHAAQLFITVAIVTTFIAIIAVLILRPVDLNSQQRELLVLLLGVLTGVFKEITSYWFGSSLSSAKKQDQITTRSL